MFTVMTDLSGANIGLSATDQVTASDYEMILMPLVDDRIKRFGKVRLLMHFGEKFKGYSLGAAWDDAKFGVIHLGHFEMLAVVTDVGWIRNTTRIIAPFLGCPVRLFANARLETAKQWIGESL